MLSPDLLEEVLRWIKPESFKAFILRHWQSHQTQDSRTNAIDAKQSAESDTEISARQKGAANFNPATLRINDHQFLIEFIPADLLRQLMQSPAGMQTLSFALRHRLTSLYLELLPDPAQPHLGFNAGGALLLAHNPGDCRHVDSHTGYQCKNKPYDNALFCKQHEAEAWWHYTANDQLPATASVQAKMLAYYHNLNNYTQYNDEELEEMLRWFWRKYQQEYAGKHSNKPQIQPEEIANRLGYASLTALENASRSEVRQAYHRASLQCHPDHGGSTEDFIMLQDAYQSWLELHAQ